MTTASQSISTQTSSFTSLQSIVPKTIFLLRLAMGWTFLVAGLTKVLDPEWSATGYLKFAIPEGNPFMGMWAAMAGNPLIDALNMWGALLIGISLLLGVLTRWSAFWGITMMLFYWASSRTGGLAQGFPDEFGFFIDDHIVYALVLTLLIVSRAGRIYGFDGRVAEKFPLLRMFT